ncbi:sel1 repeat family protein [Pseudomonas aeruginosa]|nr:sel1 repeat family protein [Pseudomonas aeruginosa]
MSKSADVFNLMDSLLAPSDQVEITEPGEVQRLYAGIGMPALRTAELAEQSRLFTYHEIKAANPLLRLSDPIRLRRQYEQLRAEALQGDADALNDLGWLWLNGSRLKPEPLLARRLFKIAAVLGSSEALFNLAEQAFYGKGVRANPLLAIDYYEQAFESGIPCAAQALGGLYERGDEGVRIDHAKAIAWYKRGADEQDTMACFLHGRLALDESSSEYNQAIGLYWLQWAAMSGEVLASERLADFYRSTFDSPPDRDGRLYCFWRDMAISQGSRLAEEMLALDGQCQLAGNR